MGNQGYYNYNQRGNYRYDDYNYMDGHRMDGHWHDKQYDSYRNKENIQTFSLNYQHQESESERGANKQLALRLELTLSEKKTIRLLVYENDDITELCVRLISFLNQQNLCKIHPEHQELFNRSLIYFIETKLQELSVPFKHSGLGYAQHQIPMPSIIKTSATVFGGLEDVDESNDGQKDKDSGTPGFKLPG